MIEKQSLIKIYLDRNKNDLIFNTAKEVDKHSDKLLKDEIRKIYSNNYSRFKSTLGYMKRYYVDGNTFTDFYTNILNNFGRGDIKKGEEKFNELINVVANEVTEKITTYADVEVKEVRNIIIVLMMWKPYLGFLFEETIKAIFENENIFNVETSIKLDSEHKIDLLISLKDEKYNDYKIGLQLKSNTYELISSYYKREHLKANIRAINRDICKDVYYLLHKDTDINIITAKDFYLHNKTSICNSRISTRKEEDYKILEHEEELIKELLNIILECYNSDNETDLDFEEFKESIYKTEKGLPKDGNPKVSN